MPRRATGLVDGGPFARRHAIGRPDRPAPWRTGRGAAAWLEARAAVEAVERLQRLRGGSERDDTLPDPSPDGSGSGRRRTRRPVLPLDLQVDEREGLHGAESMDMTGTLALNRDIVDDATGIGMRALDVTLRLLASGRGLPR